MQNEIKEKQRLLGPKGQVLNPGYAKKMLYEYHRKDIKASKFKIKEWDYYLVTNDDFGIAFTIADNSYLGFVSVTLLDFKKPNFSTFSTMKPFTMGKFNMPSTSVEGDVIFESKKISLKYLNNGECRRIICDVPNFKDGKSLSCDIFLNHIPEESMVIATPFKKNKKAFYFNQKINCMNANGIIEYNDQVIEFKDDDAILDWGRGVWTYDNIWLWGTASGKVDGVPFGINIGYGFGDTSKASENMVFYNGKAHKLDQVEFVIPKNGKKYDFMKEWKFTSNDGRFEMSFTPIIDRFDKINLLVIVSDQHQVFGKLNGYVILDDGTKIEVKDMLASAEVLHNRW